MNDVILTLAVGLGQIIGVVLAAVVCFGIRTWYSFWLDR